MNNVLNPIQEETIKETEECTEAHPVALECRVIPHASLIEEKLRIYLVNRQNRFVLKNFYIDRWECDVFSVAGSGLTNEYEVKRTLLDYKKDFTKKDGDLRKHELIKDGKRTNKFWYVIPEEWSVEIPSYAGIIRYRYNGNEISYVHKTREAKVLHKRRLLDDNKMLYNIALKCYYRLPSGRASVSV
jgi:hypothetical protein